MLRRISPKNMEGPRALPVGLHYMKFKWEVIAGLGDTWTITGEQIDEWLKIKTGSGIEDLKQRYDALDEEGKLTLRYSRKL